MNVDPLFKLEFPNKFLNSLWSLIIIKFQKKNNRLGKNQNEYGINIKPINVLNQFNDKFNKLVDGSKIENKLFIIFRKYF